MTLYRIALPRGTAYFNDNGVNDPLTGTTKFDQECTIVLHKISTTKKAQILLWLKQRLVVFVRDQNENIFMMGREDGAHCTIGNGVTGTAKGDMNGFNITFTAEERSFAPTLSPFTTQPFDNFADVTVSPAYPVPET